MTAQEYMARRVERIARALVEFVETTRSDRRSWRPAIEGGGEARSVLDQLHEVGLANRYVAALLRGEAPGPPNYAAGSGEQSAESLSSEALASARSLAEAIRGLSDEDLDETFPHARGPVTGANLIEMPYRNMAYHAGQVNFIQSLYGDLEFHAPSTWR